MGASPRPEATASLAMQASLSAGPVQGPGMLPVRDVAPRSASSSRNLDCDPRESHRLCHARLGNGVAHMARSSARARRLREIALQRGAQVRRGGGRRGRCHPQSAGPRNWNHSRAVASTRARAKKFSQRPAERPRRVDRRARGPAPPACIVHPTQQAVQHRPSYALRLSAHGWTPALCPGFGRALHSAWEIIDLERLEFRSRLRRPPQAARCRVVCGSVTSHGAGEASEARHPRDGTPAHRLRPVTGTLGSNKVVVRTCRSG
jgi:hypothetical protein